MEFPNLFKLSMVNNCIDEVGDLSPLKSLQNLDLKSNSISILDVFIDLPKLKVLNLGIFILIQKRIIWQDNTRMPTCWPKMFFDMKGEYNCSGIFEADLYELWISLIFVKMLSTFHSGRSSFSLLRLPSIF